MTTGPLPSDILVVDDTPANLAVLSSILNTAGYRVRPAISGEVALRAVNHHSPDLMLLDVNMPGMNGYQVCRQIKANPATATLPVIFISAADGLEEKVEAFRAGGVDYITKPFQAEEVVARVANQLTLNQQRREIENLGRFKDELLRTVSHDLKNPLNAIQGYTDLLREELGEQVPTAVEIIEQIRRSTDLMYHLVVTLLDLDRLEGGVILDLQPTALAALLQDIQSRFSLSARQKNIQLQLSQGEDSYIVAVDPVRLAQALANLVSNAIKYTPDGGAITLQLERDETATHIRIKDTGYGIPPEALPRLFDKFYRVDHPDHRQAEGSGLGLAIVQAVVKLHGGTIQVASHLGQGTNISIDLPRTPE